MSSARVLPLKLKTTRGIALIASYLVVSTAIEAALVYCGFAAQGLRDTYLFWRVGLWTGLIPALAIVALTLSWLHLTRSFFFEPMRPVKKVKRKKGRKKRAVSRLSTFPVVLERRLGRLGMAAARGLFVLVLGACAATILVAISVYWLELYRLTAALVDKCPPFSWLVSSLSRLGEAVTSQEQLGRAVVALLKTGMKMNKAVSFLALAAGKADPLYKYALAQNLLIWSSGLAALAYRRPPIRRR